MKKKILVTGGAGYIGSHTVVALIDAGYDVVVIDDLSNSRKEILENIRKITGTMPGFYQVNMQNEAEMQAFFALDMHFDGVIHFAALKAVGDSVKEPLRYYQNNLFSLINLLSHMEQRSINNIVFSSSCTVYGQPDQLPVTESSPFKTPESPYGNTKIMAENILADVVKASHLKTVSLRYFNPIGAHPSALIGELPLGLPNNLVPVITQVAIGKRDKLAVFGNDYPTPDGSCIRDYIHVCDLAKAHVTAMERMLNHKQKTGYEAFNIGTGTGYSVLETLEAFERVNGVKLNYEIGARRAGDVVQIYADTSYANTELGWQAHETLDSMLRSAWAWEKNIPVLFPEMK